MENNISNCLVSIIVPCFNQAQYLDESLQSVLDQTYTNWECIIVNDGSPDNTEEVAKIWLEKDKRFKYLFKENGGLSSARNFGITHAIGEFILPLDADDKISRDYVLLALQEFEKDTDLKVVYCKAEKFGDELGLLILEPYSIQELAIKNMIFCTAMFRKEDWEMVGGYDINMIYGLEDWEFWIAILKNGGGVKCLDEVCFYYRIKANSMLKRLNNEMNTYSLEYMSVKHADFFVAQFGSFLHLNKVINKISEENPRKLKSRKFVIDVFCNTFFGFKIFDKK